MATPPLLNASDLDGFAGAPFAEDAVSAAAAAVRAGAGWHIAPKITETFLVDSDGGLDLMLPTLHLRQVTAVRRVVSDSEGSTSGTTVTGVRTSATPRFRAGVLTRAGGWAPGTYEVDVAHGHDACPSDLLPAVASQCRRARIDTSTGAVRLGSLSVSAPSVAAHSDHDDVLARYRIPTRP